MATSVCLRNEMFRIIARAVLVQNRRNLCNKPPAHDTVRSRNSHLTMAGNDAVVPGNRLNMFDWLSQHGPKFFIRGEQVQVITEPAQFYEVLKLKTRKAKKRITFASLYLGNGDLEKDLNGQNIPLNPMLYNREVDLDIALNKVLYYLAWVTSVREACLAAIITGNSDFEVNLLLDYTRGSRGVINSRSMLRPLVAEFRSVRVSLYHTPDLRGLFKKIIPDRFNETIGLTHVKVYLFDDSFIISGANLSSDYFTNRQDRYILFNSCHELSNFFNDFIKSIMSFSLCLAPDNSLHLTPDWKIHPYKDSEMQFKLAARERIESFLRIGVTFQNTKSEDEHQSIKAKGKNSNQYQIGDTVVYPLVQMGPFGVMHDEQALLGLLRSSVTNDNILLASGYFNLTDYYMSVILNQTLGKFSILMASPQANGFLGAEGIAGAIPYSYIYLAHKFFKRVHAIDQHQRIHMMEYVRDGWTFHGKGLWYYLPCQSLPSLTLVGSPNFGYRSVYRDLECQVALVTENKGLQEQLREEHVRMFSSSQPVTEQTFRRRDRYVPLWIRMVTSVIKQYF